MPPDLLTNEDLMQLPLRTRWLLVCLRFNADDEGRESATPALLKASIAPFDARITIETIITDLRLLEEHGQIALYAARNRTYYQLLIWPKVSHGAESQIPTPPDDVLRSVSGVPLEFLSAIGREREGASEREGSEGEGVSSAAGQGAPAGVPPEPFCRVHMPHGTTKACRGCGNARMAYEQWKITTGISNTDRDHKQPRFEPDDTDEE